MSDPTQPTIVMIMDLCRTERVETLIPFQAWLGQLVDAKRNEWYNMQRGVKVRQDGTVDTSDL